MNIRGLDTTIEKLSNLKPVFRIDGTITAGNSSGINDGAAVLAICSDKFVSEQRIDPLAEIVSYSIKATSPELFGVAPAQAIFDALKKANLTLNDIDLIESNEAFAAQTLALSKEVGWDLNKVNVNGGAIALGHPIGASGARILVTLIHEMKRCCSEYGLAAICVGGGMGIAMLVKNLF